MASSSLSSSLSSKTNSLKKIILITGDPGVGKTTLIKRLVDKLKHVDGLKLIQGFFTEEIRDENNSRIGFDVVEINNEKRSALARTGIEETHSLRNAPRVGKYIVDVKSFESIGLPALQSIEPKTICVVDEIGKMEIASSSFEKSILQIMQRIEKENFLLIATVPIRNLNLSDKIKAHRSSKLFTVTFHNRTKIIDEIHEFVLNTYKSLDSN